jgi:hypothetical protein
VRGLSPPANPSREKSYGDIHAAGMDAFDHSAIQPVMQSAISHRTQGVTGQWDALVDAKPSFADRCLPAPVQLSPMLSMPVYRQLPPHSDMVVFNHAAIQLFPSIRDRDGRGMLFSRANALNISSPADWIVIRRSLSATANAW